MRVAALVVLTLTVAACGSPHHRPTRVEYVRRANAICRDYHAKTAALGAAPRTVAGLDAYASRTMRLLDQTTVRLRALPVAAGDEALVARWLAALGNLQVDVARIRDRARANDLAGVRRAAFVAQRDDERANALASRLGLGVCGSA